MDAAFHSRGPLSQLLGTLLHYSSLLADNGSDWYIGGTLDEHQDNDMLYIIANFTGDDIEAVAAPGFWYTPFWGRQKRVEGQFPLPFIP